MSDNTQYNHLAKCKMIVDDIFSSVRSFKLDHATMLEMTHTKLYDHNSWKRLAQHRQQYIMGYRDALYNQLWQEVDWRVYHPDLGYVWRNNYDALDGLWPEVIAGMGAHFWKDTEKNYTYPENDIRE